LRSLLVLLLTACTPAPTVAAVEPNIAEVGEVVHVVGERLAPPIGVVLVPSDPGAGEPVTAGPAAAQIAAQATDIVPTSSSPERIALTLPQDLAAGVYDVVVTTGRTTIKAPGSLRVTRPPVDVPCGGLYRANTKVSAIAGEVVLDRFYRDGQRDTVRAKLSDVASVELARVPIDGDATCSVITLVKGDGERLRFADDAAVDLSSRAHKLAQEIGRPLVRAD